MWIAGSQLQQIGSALETGPTHDIDRLLADLLAARTDGPATPGACAVCRRELLRAELVPGRLVVYACPAEHGAWLDAEARAALERFLAASAAPSGSGRRMKVLLAILTASVVGLVATMLAIPMPHHLSPPRPMTPEERQYVVELMRVLDDGIRNRSAIDRALKTQAAPDAHRAAYDTYREQQERMLARLRGLAVPKRTRPVHERIVVATERQMAFYLAFVNARARGDSADVTKLLGHPDLRATDYELHAAWDTFRNLYPGLDQKFYDALESRLCWFDVI